MTKLPAETWDVKPRLDLGTYERNDICPITGQVDELEDHHIWRKSFTALGAKKNALLYWVEIDGQVYPNRVWIARDVHRVITEGSGRIFLVTESSRQPDVTGQGLMAGAFYYQDAEMEYPEPLNPQPGPQGVTVSPQARNLPEHRHGPGVAPGEECPACHRKMPLPRELREKPKRRGTWSIKVPKYKAGEDAPFEEDGAAILDEKIQGLRERLYRMRGWQADVPNYFVLIAALELAEIMVRDFEEGVDT